MWQRAGAVELHTRAEKRVRDILSKDDPGFFSPEVDAEIRATFEGVVSGDVLPLDVPITVPGNY